LQIIEFLGTIKTGTDGDIILRQNFSQFRVITQRFDCRQKRFSGGLNPLPAKQSFPVKFRPSKERLPTMEREGNWLFLEILEPFTTSLIVSILITGEPASELQQ